MGITTVKDLKVVKIPPMRRCRDKDLKAFKAALEQQPLAKGREQQPLVVLILTYQHMVCHPRNAYTKQLDLRNQCQRDFMDVIHAHKRSLVLRKEAKRFTREHLRCKGGYLAIHLRPYPDKCITKWIEVDNATREWTKKDGWECPRTPDLWDNFPREVQAALQAQNLKCLYIMTYPSLIPVVIRRMEAQIPRFDKAVTTAAYSIEELEKQLKLKDFMRLSLVEQEICSRAKLFIGTAASSMSAAVIQERTIAGLGNSTLTFTQHNAAPHTDGYCAV